MTEREQMLTDLKAFAEDSGNRANFKLAVALAQYFLNSKDNGDCSCTFNHLSKQLVTYWNEVGQAELNG